MLYLCKWILYACGFSNWLFLFICIDESCSLLLNEPNWMQESMGHFMNIQSHDFDGIELSRLIRTFVVCFKIYIIYL